IDPAELHAIEAAARAALDGQPIDIIAQGTSHRRKALLIADMDSTVIEQECIDELAAEAGIGAHVADITERAMRGELAFEPALRERVKLLEGLPEAKLEQVFETRITLSPGIRTVTDTMRLNGGYCALVSGGFTFFTARVAVTAGFDTNRANTLEMKDGHLTGAVTDPILGRAAKLESLQQLAAEHSLAIESTMAVGDGANDLAMIEAAGIGVAYHAKPVVAQAAPARLDHTDLTSLLYIQGYARDEFAGQ
ncbi:MAG: phosphoserine phosphatase SerB, partial [Pseudomonadota bacterium]